MDIEKLQKVNALAREYVKHGIAPSMDVAVNMAEDKFKDSFRDKLPQVDTSNGPAQPAKIGATPAPSPKPYAPPESKPYTPPAAQVHDENKPKPDVPTLGATPTVPVAPTPAPGQPVVNAEKSEERKLFDELTNIVKTQATQIENISSKMNEMIKEINDLKDKVEKVSRPTVAPASVAPTKDGNVQTQFKPQPKPEKKNNVRTGKYGPGDVSVEKVFYSGTGR